ncbi:hypothetical protein DFP73DRAFT_551149 [Morchella snyderi]|nr:hypothetical protein DFP73DRAFT_551149 [Morchella snyderi]
MTGHVPNQLGYPSESSMEPYRHPSRGPPAPTVHERAYLISRPNPRMDPHTRPPPRAPHVTSSAANSPRRRIPVACGRCRRRKIRCSGDPGDNSGCLNCKQAQVEQGKCTFLRVQCEMRELVPDHVLMMGYEQVSSAPVDLHHHPYSTSSSASSSASSLAMASVQHHNATPSQIYNMSAHALRAGHSGPSHHMHNSAMPLRSLCHQDPLGGNGSGGDSTSGLLLSGRYENLGGDMTGGPIHGSNGNVMTVSNGDMYNGTYAPYLHPDITSNLHGQQWAAMSGGRSSSLYLDQDHSAMNNYISPNQSMGNFGVVFPALSSLSSSLPDGASPRTPGSEKVQLPLPIRTQASEAMANNTGNLRPPSTGNTLVNDPTPSSYERQSLQASYRVFPSSWAGDASFSTASQSAGMAGNPPTATGMPSQPTPALPVPCQISTYGAHNPPTFPPPSSNSSLLPSLSQQNPLISGSSVDSFPQALAHQQTQKNRSNSESSNNSKTITPAATNRTSSTPSYTRSSVVAVQRHEFSRRTIDATA